MAALNRLSAPCHAGAALAATPLVVSARSAAPDRAAPDSVQAAAPDRAQQRLAPVGNAHTSAAQRRPTPNRL